MKRHRKPETRGFGHKQLDSVTGEPRFPYNTGPASVRTVPGWTRPRSWWAERPGAVQNRWARARRLRRGGS